MQIHLGFPQRELGEQDELLAVGDDQNVTKTAGIIPNLLNEEVSDFIAQPPATPATGNVVERFGPVANELGLDGYDPLCTFDQMISYAILAERF
ncbi:MAG TPA: hypothetical protein PKC45_18110 [Gemmatales bacterium]|nr:hypothetical protein [Gemmatales bacterium]